MAILVALTITVVRATYPKTKGLWIWSLDLVFGFSVISVSSSIHEIRRNENHDFSLGDIPTVIPEKPADYRDA